VEAPGNDGNASMPEQVKRPNPWRKMMMMIMKLMKLEFSGQIFEKYSNIRFQENPSSGSRVVPCGLTDGRTVRQT